MNDDFNSRDLFAGLAMVGLIVANGYSRGVIPMAYDIAEQMLREKKELDTKVPEK